MAGERSTTGLIDIATPNLTIGGVIAQDVDPQITDWQSGSASVDNQLAATMNMRPKISFTTTDLANALTACGIAGCLIAGFDCYELLKDNHGEIKSGAVHPKNILADGLMVPRQISFNGGDDPVTVSFEAFGTASDGATNPLTRITAAAPAGGGMAAAYTLSSLTFGGSPILEINSLTFDFGLGVEHKVNGGELVPRKANINARDPIINFTSEDNAVAATFGLAGSSGAVVLTFVKLATAGRAANTVTLTITNAFAVMRARSAQHRQDTGIPVEIKPIISGANPILTIGTT